jgi:N-glycosylase/DNA lyase
MDVDEAERELREIHGVGPKVAACALLFGLGKTEAFPVDVWMKKAMNSYFGIDGRNGADARKQAAVMFGRYAGVAQQYLFYYIRNGGEPLTPSDR